MAALSQILHGCCSKPGQLQVGLGPDESTFGREGGGQSEPWFLVSKLNTEITIWKAKYKSQRAGRNKVSTQLSGRMGQDLRWFII